MNDVRSRENFITFARALSESATHGNNAHMNLDVARYLDALAAWTHDMDGWFANNHEPVPEPRWLLFATILNAALTYE